MYKNLKNNNDKSAGGNSTTSRQFAVIFGLVPKILLQQVTNLVNKLAILFKRSMFQQDCRNASGNDGYWDCGYSGCCIFFKYPSPNANALHSPSGDEVFKQVLLPQCAPDATGFLSDVYKRGTRARKFLADGVQGGRSMIEMLGVLAIIAVLSVGGIAGYSKAMEKYKINKTLDQVTTILSNLVTLFANKSESFYQKRYIDNEENYNLVKDLIYLPEMDNGFGQWFTHALGGKFDVDVYGDHPDGTYGVGYGFFLYGLSKDACIALATYDWGGVSSGYAAISINKAYNDNHNIGYCYYRGISSSYLDSLIFLCKALSTTASLPLSPDLAAKGCNKTDNKNHIELLFEI